MSNSVDFILDEMYAEAVAQLQVKHTAITIIDLIETGLIVLEEPKNCIIAGSVNRSDNLMKNRTLVSSSGQSFTCFLNEGNLDRIDKITSEYGYKNRSVSVTHAIQIAIRVVTGLCQGLDFQIPSLNKGLNFPIKKKLKLDSVVEQDTFLM